MGRLPLLRATVTFRRVRDLMSLARSIGRTLGIAVFTAVETLALGLWLALVRGEPTLSTVALAGVGVLLVGLVVEAVVNTVVVNGLRGLRPGAIATFSGTETLIWVVWLLVAEWFGGLTGVGVAGILLFVLMLPQHSIEDNALRGRALFSDVVHSGTAVFTVVEVVGATVWLALVLRGPELLGGIGLGLPQSLPPLAPEAGAAAGLLFLAVALFVEHEMGVQFALRLGQPGSGV